VNELLTRDGTTLTYDHNGNMTTDGGKAYVWDEENRLSSVNGAYYQYDAEGRRISKTVAGVTTQYIYDGWQVVQESSNLGVTKFFTYGNYIDEPVCMVTTTATSSDTIYYLQGNNYNIAALTDEAARVVEHYAGQPYGAFALFTGEGADATWFTSDDMQGAVSSVANQILFQGRTVDNESGDYYFRNRCHSPFLGRFVSPDPAGYVEGASLYSFAGNTPSVYLDPFGYEKCCVKEFAIRKTGEENTIYEVRIEVAIEAEFKEGGDCCARCCWYEHRVRGRIRMVSEGKFKDVTSKHLLYKGVPLDKYRTNEDGVGSYRIGHRGEDAGFTQTGYSGSDKPRFALEQKASRLDAFYYFESRIRDGCNDDQEVELRTWGMKAWGNPDREPEMWGRYHLETWGLAR
jgi:RHS repeat-associated protein